MKIANALLLASLASSNAETSFLRASVTTGDALQCFGGCIQVDGKTKHFTKNKIYKSALDCAVDCLPSSKRDSATISCASQCLKKQASSIEKAADKAIDNANDKEIKKCQSKCDKDDKECAKACAKQKFKNSSKDVAKEVQKKASKVVDSAKGCLSKCLAPGEVDFMMESEDYEDSEDFDLEEESSSSKDDDDDEDPCEENKRKETKCLKLQDKKQCSWVDGKCRKYQKPKELDFELEEKSSEDEDKNDKDKDDDRKKKVDCSKKENKDLKACKSRNRIDKASITCAKYWKNESKCSEQEKNKVCFWNADKKRCTVWKKRELDFDSEDVEDEEDVVTALA